MADLLSKLRMLDAAPRRPALAAREAQEGCYRSQATFPLSIFCLLYTSDAADD